MMNKKNLVKVVFLSLKNLYIILEKTLYSSILHYRTLHIHTQFRHSIIHHSDDVCMM